jgi:hypothetical protein
MGDYKDEGVVVTTPAFKIVKKQLKLTDKQQSTQTMKGDLGKL